MSGLRVDRKWRKYFGIFCTQSEPNFGKSIYLRKLECYNFNY